MAGGERLQGREDREDREEREEREERRGTGRNEEERGAVVGAR